MSQRALALSRRALRESTRSKAPVVVRGLLIGLLFLSVVTAHEMARVSSAAGPHLLSWMAWTDWALITLLGVSTFSSVITEEKELMSLGLLRLAGFTPASLLLGKSVGLLLQTLLLIIVQIPFCMLAITMGGVTLDQILSVFGLLLSYALLVYSLGLLCSVVRARTRAAAMMTGGLLFAYHVLPLICGFLVNYFFMPIGGSELPAFAAVLDDFFKNWFSTTALSGLGQSTMSIGGIGLVLGSHTTANLGIAVGLFGISWLVFDPCNRNETPAAPSRGFSLAGLFRGQRTTTYRAWEGNPFLWKEYRFLAGGRTSFLLRIVIYGAFFAIILFFNSAMFTSNGLFNRELGDFMMGSMCFALVLEIALQLGRVLQQEVKHRTLASLFALPHSLPYIVWSKIVGGLWLSVPALCYFLIGALMSPLGFGSAVENILGEATGWMVLAQIVTGFHLTVFYSLRFKRGAFAMALATVFLGNILCLMVISALSLHRGPAEGIAALATICMVALCGALQFAIGNRIRALVAEG